MRSLSPSVPSAALTMVYFVMAVGRSFPRAFTMMVGQEEAMRSTMGCARPLWLYLLGGPGELRSKSRLLSS